MDLPAIIGENTAEENYFIDSAPDSSARKLYNRVNFALTAKDIDQFIKDVPGGVYYGSTIFIPEVTSREEVEVLDGTFRVAT